MPRLPIAVPRPDESFNPVERAVDELERSGRDLRTVTLEEFKSLMTDIALREARVLGC